ncbi:hypothetical protein RPB_3425 [Rhodopseudomonas palustris HaA2]|uniref:Uncharacterized protein n=1 Tax=Rhodopseudomonas palustris (strain HaA2) TaxID=316058 RepID=Q2IUI9_RHOP2|nr:hypothetical protein [Rhodopseudomonas palustris]ABD08121.1 hypothetical protein RPB_3425 [Rhodopseudomonas palustris HaA2]
MTSSVGRVFMFNPLVSGTYGPSQSIVVNSNGPPYVIKNTSPRIDYVPFSTSGERAPGSQPFGNAFVDRNELLITNDVSWNYQFDIGGFPGDLIAYLFRSQIVLLASNGIFLASYGAKPASPRQVHERAGETAGRASEAGCVFVFNLFSEQLSFMSNGGRAGDIPAWSDGKGGAAIYTPNTIAVARVLDKSDAKGRIFNGANAITVTTETIGSFTLDVDGRKYPLVQDLLLYLLRDRWYLFDEFGADCTTGPIEFDTPHFHPGRDESASRRQPSGDRHHGDKG